MIIGKSARPDEVLKDLEAQGIDTAELGPIGVRPPISQYLRDLWSRRHFIWMDARHRVATQNSRNRLGSVWLLLRPLLDAAMYYVVFALLLHVNRDMDNYTAFIIIGVLMFRSTMRAISQGPGTLRAGRAMIRAFIFPRAALVISGEIRDALQMVYTLPIVVLMIMILRPHEWPEFTWFLVPAIFALQFFLNLGLSFMMARIGFLLPDTAQLMSFVGRLLMSGSGVIFPIDRFLGNPTAAFLIHVNPIYHMLVLYRGVLMDGVIPPAHHWVILGGWGLGLTVIGFVFFWRGEATYAGEH